MNTRVLGITSSCRNCSNRSDRTCTKVDQLIVDIDQVAGFCPLTVWPGRQIAELEQTVQLLSAERSKFSLPYVLLAHVAAKVGVCVYANGSGLDLYFEDGKKERTITLRVDHMRSLSLAPSIEIVFMWDNKNFRLCPDSNPPNLCEELSENRWTHHTLKKR